MNYLLDTCTISDFFKKIPTVINHYKSISPESIHISSITVMEIEYGLRLNAERAKKIQPLWKELIKHIHVVTYSPQCAIASAMVRATLKSQGLPIGPYDVLIAGTAIAHQMTIVTSNINEFTRIHNVAIEDWRNPSM